jgi:hypothetical protein
LAEAVVRKDQLEAELAAAEERADKLAQEAAELRAELERLRRSK